MVSLLKGRRRMVTPWKLDRRERELLKLVQPYTMVDPIRLATLHLLARQVCEKGITGDIVECGVCNGGSAAIMAAAVAKCTNHRLWLYDTFEGIPQAQQQDGELAQKYTGHFVGSVQNVKEALIKVGYPKNQVVLRKGLFLDTFKEELPDKVALLHLDGDWYDSVLSALETFYPLVCDGGFIVLDDFGYWEGARKAFYDFCRTTGIQPLLERVGHTQAFWRKGLEHNRDLYNAFEYGVYHIR